VTPRNRRLAPVEAADDVLDVAATRRDAPESNGSSSSAMPTSRSLSPARVARWVSATRAVLGAVLVLGLSTTVAWAARRHILSSPRFAIDDIVVQGARLRTPEKLAAEAGIAKGMNVFALDLDHARAQLLSDPWIESATLARHLPGKVLIQVSERELGAIVALPEAYLAARDGRIFKRLEVGDPDDLPIITGLTSDAVAQDRPGVQRAIVRALDLAGDYERTPLAARAPLQEVHISNGDELTLVVGKEGVSLALGLPPFRHKLEEAARIWTELERRGAHPSVVMLDDEARPDRVVVRTR
jgi:cell division protein FtsQ